MLFLVLIDPFLERSKKFQILMNILNISLKRCKYFFADILIAQNSFFVRSIVFYLFRLFFTSFFHVLSFFCVLRFYFHFNFSFMWNLYDFVIPLTTPGFKCLWINWNNIFLFLSIFRFFYWLNIERFGRFGSSHRSFLTFLFFWFCPTLMLIFTIRITGFTLKLYKKRFYSYIHRDNVSKYG